MANWWDDAPLADAVPTETRQPRGIRNNNPLNIEAGNFTASQAGFQGSDGRFAKFATPEQGYAAADNLLGVYSDKHGINTIQGVINRWAPANDGNPVSAYAASVARDVGVAPDQPLDLKNPQVRAAVSSAMAKFENGKAVPRSTDISAQSKNWWDAAPLAQEAAPSQTPSDLPRVRISTASDKADRGVVDAAARGVAQGFTANFGDEIRGLVEASGANPNEPASVYKLISGALKYWSGDKDAKKRYDETVAREREINKAAEEQHPVASIAGNIGGAVLLPVGAAGQAATLPGRMTAGAGVGAVLGGAAGVGEGVGAVDSASRGAVGAAAGGALGAAAPAAIEGIIRGGRWLATPVANAIRGIRNVDDEAARRVVTSLQRDINADPAAASRLTPGEFAASVQSGGPATIMDIGGDTTRALARSAANTSPEGRATLNRAIDQRYEGQTGRVTGWLRNTFHYPDAAAQQQALEQVGRTVNRANYQRAMRDGDREIFSPELDRLMGSPAVVDAMRRASVSGKDRAITQGLGAMRQGVTVENGVVTFTRGRNGAPTYPNLAFWDATKKEIDDAANAAARSGRNGEAGVLRDLARTLRGELDNQVPSYQQARAGAAHFFGAENALEAGQNFVARNANAGEARRALTQMTPQERQLFQDGFVSRFVETLGQVGDRRSVLNKIAESPAAREKLNVALGRARAQELEAGLRVEGIMDLARNAVQGNSTTARQLAELGLAGGAYGFSGGGINPFADPAAALNAAFVYGAARGKNVINERLSRRVAEMLVSNDPRTITRGIQTIANNQNLFNSLRVADRGIARAGGEQSGGLPALQAAGVSRAEDQPDVPRPPGQ